MNNVSSFFFSMMFLISTFSTSFTQEKIYRQQQEPILIQPANHDPNFVETSDKSFYQLENNWQVIIDSTWGPGLPFQQKLDIFDAFTSTIRNEFDGFLSLGMNFDDWDTLAAQYRDQINDSTSKGRFGAIMTYLSFKLKDHHTAAADRDIVFFTPLNPGTPIFATSGFVTIEHCGTVITITPDSSCLVLRSVPNHPLGLQPGDIILGYEGIPYLTIMQQLIAAELPRLYPRDGSESANFDSRLLGAAMNWHLFQSIDILQYSTGNILNLSTAPMINLNIPPMLNNEQVEIPGIPFPDYFNDDVVSYGILNNTNIGYIYLFSEVSSINPHPDNQFYQAVNELQNTEGLIIDMRWNNGGWAFFDDAFEILFHESFFTLNGANRCSPTIVNLCPNNYSGLHRIEGDKSSIYDHPIAVLLGPTCVSMADRTAHRLRYHPMVSFFGKPSAASFGLNQYITTFTGWFLRYSIEDMYHVGQPGVYLNRSEFPIDFPVWHNKHDAANGIDAVVEEELAWINSMIHIYNISKPPSFVQDTLTITANVANPNSHNINPAIIINTLDSIFVDSLLLYDDGNHGDSLAGDGLYGTFLDPPSSEDIFTISGSVTDLDSNHYHILPNASQYTTIGPVDLDSLEIPAVVPSGFALKLFLKNNGSNATANNVTAAISISDTNISSISNNRNFGSITPGEIKSASNYTVVTKIHPDSLNNLEILIKISSFGYMFWEDDTIINVRVSSIKTNPSIPIEFSIKQNYPNPFNPKTTIEFSIPKTEFVNLKIFNLLGQEVNTLVSEKLTPGEYKYTWDASHLASGVYIYKLEAGNYSSTKKLILLK